MKLTMCMIARNEADNIKRCFDSWWNDVDEVVLVDTGSTDTTVRTAKSYAYDRGEADKLIIETYDWHGDFAAARNYADSLATGDWRTWCDLDDEVIGLGNLRRLAEGADPNIYQYYVRYEYALDNLGNCFCELWRERLVKADAPTQGWQGRVHECQIIPPPMTMVDRDICRWRHLRDFNELSTRNEELLWEWVDQEPDNARALSYLAFELMGRRVAKERPDGSTEMLPDADKLQASIPIFHRYLACPGEPPEARAQSTRRLAQVYLALGNLDAAYQVSAPMLAEAPGWSDTKLTLAEIAHERQEWPKVVEFANQVFKQGIPETTLIVNPMDYQQRPRVLMASAFASLNRIEEAVKIAQQVMEVNPDYMGIGIQCQQWLKELGIEQTAGTWANCAQLLVSQDEPEKALHVLATVPFFIEDHPLIIGARVMVKLALGEPYVVEPIGDSARGNFLIRSLRELVELREQEAERVRRERIEAECAAAGEPVVQHPEGATT